ncbi:hypothetical protein LINPERPRIM_LOCUS21211 [Linum perenne]
MELRFPPPIFEHELRSAPLQLRSSPQQLRSAPQQLRSSPQQLRSAPQQLRSDPLQLDQVLCNSDQVHSNSDRLLCNSDQVQSEINLEDPLEETNSISIDSIIPYDKRTWNMLKFESSSDALAFYKDFAKHNGFYARNQLEVYTDSKKQKVDYIYYVVHVCTK